MYRQAVWLVLAGRHRYSPWVQSSSNLKPYPVGIPSWFVQPLSIGLISFSDGNIGFQVELVQCDLTQLNRQAQSRGQVL